ncbi:hypothetical protein BFS35_007230 [Macrococcoides goetzii]|uniref:Uncharacterized protein n=1 Tax=Macrococcoides goetzii TaxID=1891097 RepID=A0A395GBI5_9STAP|nr:hypothetical protein [Macrococcus goetzii]RAI81354.1 hypothetical protein BFS35_007230 [Macrococcus goetzii]
MKYLIKPFLYFVTILLTIVLGVVIFQNNRALMSENAAKAMVAERYTGEIKDFYVTANKQYFKVTIEDKKKRFQFKIDRYNEKISNLKVLKRFETRDEKQNNKSLIKKEKASEEKNNIKKEKASKTQYTKEVKSKQTYIEESSTETPSQHVQQSSEIPENIQNTSRQPMYTQEAPNHQQQSNIQVQKSPYYYYSDDDDDSDYEDEFNDDLDD